MQRYIVIRILEVIAALIVVSALVFWIERLTGDPRDLLLPADATKEDYARLGKELGLDAPMVTQYGIFVRNALQLDFGRSIRTRQPVKDLIVGALPNSLSLAVVAMVLSLLLVIPLGVLSAVKKGTLFDTAARLFAVLGQAVPSFWFAILLILFFSVFLQWLPSSGAAGPMSYILPAIVMGWSVSAGLTRLLRSSMLEVLGSEFVKMARVKGVSEAGVILKHALRNALIPVVTFLGLYFGLMVGNAVIIETVFAWPGIGRLGYQAMIWRDYPLFQGVLLLVASLVLVSNLVVDVLYAYLDPRIRY